MAKKIKMFKPGKHVGMDGKTYEFSEADLRAAAQAYNPELHAAPLVIGHPQHDAPAYGRLTTVDFAEGFLLGEPSKVDPAFAEAVNAGRFDRVSLSFYSPTAPGNPVPGVFYPRHLGFLGAVPPGVKGLGAVSFAESNEGVISFGDWNDRLIARMFRNMKNYLIEAIGQEKADKVLDEWDLQSITEEAVRPEPPMMETEPVFAEHQQGGKSMKTAEQIAAIEAENVTLRAALRGTATAAAHAANLAFCEGLVKEGKLLPANQAKVVAVLDFACALEGGNTIEFGEGDGKKTEPVVDTLKGVLSSYPKVIEFAELGAGEESGAQSKTVPANIATFV